MRLTDNQIAGMINDLIERGEIAEALYELVLGQACSLLEKRRMHGSHLKDEAHSLAIDCLLELRTRRKINVQTAAHLSHELSKYLTRRESPAFHEVWKALSQALCDLEKEGLVERRAPSSGVNRQDTEWCLAGGNFNTPSNTRDFFEAASVLTVYCPTRKDGRLLAPAQARELALKMLDLAGGLVLMQDLHREAMRHVVLQMLYPEPIENNEEEHGRECTLSRCLADRMPFSDYFLQEEAAERARQIWDRLEKSGDVKTLCLYFIPKHLLGNPVTGTDLGDPRRISEGGERIREAFRGFMDLTPTRGERREAAAMAQRDPSFGELSGQQTRLLGRISEILMKFCAEKSLDGNLTPEKGDP